MMLTAKHAVPALAVLVSGGLDSCILLTEAVRTYAAVFPLYVRFGLTWESVELQHLRHFLEAVAAPALQPLQILDMPVHDLYGAHWSLTGDNVPDAATPDEAVFLPGRNVLLLAKGLLWCHLHGIAELALGTLAGNPFADATPAFFAAFTTLVDQAMSGNVRIRQPYHVLHKVEVLQRGHHLPLEWTFSCIRPCAGRHCGVCNKCAERRRGFHAAKLADRTVYHQEGPCTA